MAYSMYNKRGYFYDVRNLPYGYYGMHPMDVMEYQRGRPTKLPVRLLNRQFKQATIQPEDEHKAPLVVSVQSQTIKGKQQTFLVLSNNSEADYSGGDLQADSGISVPESLAPQLVQQVRKLVKWKPTASGNLPTAGQGLAFEDAVFKAQIVNVAEPEAASPESRQLAIKILAESRARDPQERKELSSVVIPMEPNCMDKLRQVLADLVVTGSPLYHTESLQGSDGSKFYLDLIKDDSAHYLKISQVTRDYRSIINVPAGDVEALLDLLDTSLKALKTQSTNGKQQPAEGGSGKAGGKRKRGGRNPRRRPTAPQKRRGSGGVGGGGGPAAAAADSGESAATSAAAEEGKTGGSQSSDSEEKENAKLRQQPDSSEDNSTVESRPVENGDGDKLATTE